MKLHETEIQPYLANVILLARADGSLSTRESAALEQIRQEIGGKRGDMTKAQRLAESDSYQLAKVGSFSAQIQNLEDMLFVCLTDGELAKPETELISTFCKLIGITEEQQARILAETQRRISRDSGTITCPTCGQQVAAQAKFCGNCGASLQTENSVQLNFKLPDSGFAIEFSDSSASDFPAALEKAKSAFSYQTCLKSGKNWHLAIFNGDEFQKAVELADLLRGQRNKKFYINGQEEDWNAVFGFSWCASQRKLAYKPAEYCFGKDEKRLNLWGCKQVRMDWTSWAGWFAYGSFKPKGFLKNTFVWKFDKEKILHEVNTNIQAFRFCPHLNVKLIEAVLESLPDEIEVSENPGPWKFKRAYEEVPGAVKVVEKRNYGDGISMSDEFFAIGVEPTDLNVARQILQAAFSKCGISEISANELTN
jgi:uncharacterized tellurite resistance protein B-like protein